MNISWTQLNNLPVETASGEYIGRVCDCVCDVKTLSITHLEVKHGHLTHRKKLLIHQSNIISISREKVVIKDGLVGNEKASAKQETPLPNAVLPTQTERV